MNDLSLPGHGVDRELGLGSRLRACRELNENSSSGEHPVFPSSARRPSCRRLPHPTVMVLTRSQRGSSEDRKPQDEARAQPTIERTAQAPQSHASRPGGNALKRKLTAVQDEGLVNTVGNAVDATIQRGTASPSTSLHSLDDDDVADVTGYFGVLPREIIEQILGYLEPKELAMMDMTCRFVLNPTAQAADSHNLTMSLALGSFAGWLARSLALQVLHRVWSHRSGRASSFEERHARQGALSDDGQGRVEPNAVGLCPEPICGCCPGHVDRDGNVPHLVSDERRGPVLSWLGAVVADRPQQGSRRDGDCCCNDCCSVGGNDVLVLCRCPDVRGLFVRPGLPRAARDRPGPQRLDAADPHRGCIQGRRFDRSGHAGRQRHPTGRGPRRIEPLDGHLEARRALHLGPVK